ncbi:MAG: sulfatase-like hydrolase/transferase [Planctomycetota bacterium]|nr:sulfatase-like hydrolase/transferase [Planctomycetota bacterium]
MRLQASSRALLCLVLACGPAWGAGTDCNGNGVPDDQDIANGTSLDCNQNGVPDECDLAGGNALDCNQNGVPDSCDLGSGTSADCNGNGILDDCDLSNGISQDCNQNSVPDECDTGAGTSSDCNANLVPDECEPDCDGNGVPDECDVGAGGSSDCNQNGVPDSCDLASGASPDCNGNAVPDECDLANGASLDCDGNGLPDECDLAGGGAQDCNQNAIPDACDLAAGTSTDCDGNAVPDECDPDCNQNAIPDACDIAGGTSEDCNQNGSPDECDTTDGTSVDANSNTIPDECENPYNVIVVLADDLAVDVLQPFDSINPYEGTTDPSQSLLYVDAPNLQALADGGVTFTQANAGPVCSVSRASLLSGVYPRRHGVGTSIRHDHIGEYPLGLAEFGDTNFVYLTIADVMQAGGRRTGLFGKWHLGLSTPEMDPGGNGTPGALGWDSIAQRGRFADFGCTFRNLDDHPFPPGAQGGYYHYYRNDNGVIEQLTEYATTLQFTEALEFCNEVHEPFFALVAPNACHSPWDELPPAGLVNTAAYMEGAPTILKNYGAMVEAFDTELGNLVDGLEPGRRSRTMIIVVGDNGTDERVLESARDDHGYDLGPTYDALLDSPKARFKSSVYERGMRVPMIVNWEGIVQPGRTSDAVVDMVDVFKSTMDFVEGGAGDVDGVSFLPVLTDPSIGLLEHERQESRAEFHEDNGARELAVAEREVGYSLILPDGRRFKLHREFLVPSMAVVDQLFQLRAASGLETDPWELVPLPIGVGQPFHDEYLTVAEGLAPGLQYNYCVSEPNSTGQASIMDSVGSTSIGTDDLVLVADHVSPGQFGVFFYGPTETQIPFGNGFRCVGGGSAGIVRFAIVTANPLGDLICAVDYEHVNPPNPSRIHPGSTWKFQAWFRDPEGGGSGFDLSNGRSITFLP